MSRATFQRAAKSILARLGEGALLRGEVVTPARRAHVGHNVQLMQGDMAVVKSVATMMKADNARSGDTLTLIDAEGVPIAGESYVLEAFVEDNGYTTKHVARRV